MKGQSPPPRKHEGRGKERRGRQCTRTGTLSDTGIDSNGTTRRGRGRASRIREGDRNRRKKMRRERIEESKGKAKETEIALTSACYCGCGDVHERSVELASGPCVCGNYSGRAREWSPRREVIKENARHAQFQITPLHTRIRRASIEASLADAVAQLCRRGIRVLLGVTGLCTGTAPSWWIAGLAASAKVVPVRRKEGDRCMRLLGGNKQGTSVDCEVPIVLGVEHEETESSWRGGEW
ncbi:hypothetical protein K438DRAFT_1753435 [Mycena galopus ATCC 62051]|nr:hypothetical protein K438DRAFT_1753435 [Mycena galopus ATCC 62051]